MPFALSSRLQFLPEAPPALTSELYARDFNQVKMLGGVNSTVRTAEQTTIARNWAGVGYSTSAPGVWFNLGRDLGRARGLSGLDMARVFALLAIAITTRCRRRSLASSSTGCGGQRRAIRAADRDDNPATEPDATFVSLIPTPPYPSYPGNMACIGASSSALFTVLWGRDDIPFSVTWTGINQADVTRSYNGFRQLADEEAISRIYARHPLQLRPHGQLRFVHDGGAVHRRQLPATTLRSVAAGRSTRLAGVADCDAGWRTVLPTDYGLTGVRR